MKWKKCKGYQRYEVSDTGIVRNIKTKRVMKQGASEKGYFRVGLTKDDGRPYPAKVHRLVAEAFLPNPMNYPSVDHINRIRSDNRLSNLRWLDNSTNNSNRIYNVGIVEHIIELYNSGMTAEDIYSSI